MNNLEELKKCRVVKCDNSHYLVENNGLRWINLVSGNSFFVSGRDYGQVKTAYKTFYDYLNHKPFFTDKDALLGNSVKEWLKYIVRSLKNVNVDTLFLRVFENYCCINFRTNKNEWDNIPLADFENIIFDFSKLEKNKIYTFKELGIKL